ncbi:MAG TPA: TrfB-related DNA-binding protein, partial [Gammaproteobacteria bacterium]
MLISYLNIFGIENTLDALQENGLKMKDRHFELATRNLTINPRNKDAVRRVMVGGEQIVHVAESVGMHHTQLGKQVRRILQNFEKELGNMGLSFE